AAFDEAVGVTRGHDPGPRVGGWLTRCSAAFSRPGRGPRGRSPTLPGAWPGRSGRTCESQRAPRGGDWLRCAGARPASRARGAAAEPAAPWLAPARHSGPSAAYANSGGVWGRSSSFAYSACLVDRFADADRAFTAARASAEKAGVPEAIAGLAVGHSYTLTRMG